MKVSALSFTTPSHLRRRFELRPDRGRQKQVQRPVFAGTVEEVGEGLSERLAAFRDLFNDPMTLAAGVCCANCGERVEAGERAFAVQDYEGHYIGYVCPSCHPNRKWINGLWRSVLGEPLEVAGHEGRQLNVPMIASTVH